jgi:hypothetical protein
MQRIAIICNFAYYCKISYFFGWNSLPDYHGSGLLRIVLPSTAFTSTGSARYPISSPLIWLKFTFTVPSAFTGTVIYRGPISFALAVGKSPVIAVGRIPANCTPEAGIRKISIFGGEIKKEVSYTHNLAYNP